MVAGGGHAWLLVGGMHDCQGACVVAWEHAWLLVGGHAWQGGMHGCWEGIHGCQGVCVVAGGGMCVVAGRGMHGCWGVCVVAGGGACVVAGRGACMGYDDIRRYDL